MQHAGQPKIMHVRVLARNFGRNVHTRHRLTHKFVVGVLFERNFGVNFDFKPLTDQAAVRGCSAAGLMGNHAVYYRQLCSWNGPLLGRTLQQSLARVGRSNSQLITPLRNGDGRTCKPLVWCGSGVAHHHLNPAKAHVKLICSHLSQCGFGTRTQIHLAHIQRDAVFGINGQPRVQRIFGHTFGRWQVVGRLSLTRQ